jgi:hypothetical protein
MDIMRGGKKSRSLDYARDDTRGGCATTESGGRPKKASATKAGYRGSEVIFSGAVY